jgi:hypothetical protein
LPNLATLHTLSVLVSELGVVVVFIDFIKLLQTIWFGLSRQENLANVSSRFRLIPCGDSETIRKVEVGNKAKRIKILVAIETYISQQLGD